MFQNFHKTVSIFVNSISNFLQIFSNLLSFSYSPHGKSINIGLKPLHILNSQYHRYIKFLYSLIISRHLFFTRVGFDIINTLIHMCFAQIKEWSLNPLEFDRKKVPSQSFIRPFAACEKCKRTIYLFLFRPCLFPNHGFWVRDPPTARALREGCHSIILWVNKVWSLTGML